MRAPRFSIRTLMMGLVAIGVGLAVMRTGTYNSFRSFYGMTILGLLLSIIAARYRPSPESAFWFGFAVLGWGYFLIGLSPWEKGSRFFAPGGEIQIGLEANPLLPTNDLIKWLAEDQIARRSAQTRKSPLAYGDVRANLIGAGHLLCVWVFGAFGGVIAIALAGCPGVSMAR